MGAPLPEIGALLAGRYRIEALLGEGGMGAVFSVTDEAAGCDLTQPQRAALKWLNAGPLPDDQARRRFRREASFAQRLVHPNVVRVYELGEHDGHPFLVMELLIGETLRQRVRRAAPSWNELAQLLGPAMSGVATIHELGIVHRDLKPENIFLRQAPGRADEAVVLDFGISAQWTDAAPASMRLTRTGHVLGTPYYMAPEQATARPIDQRADIYALGVILYEALTGHLPFKRSSIAVWKVRQLDSEPRSIFELLPDCPERIGQSIMRALSRDENGRHPNVRAFMRSLGLPYYK